MQSGRCRRRNGGGQEESEIRVGEGGGFTNVAKPEWSLWTMPQPGALVFLAAGLRPGLAPVVWHTLNSTNPQFCLFGSHCRSCWSRAGNDRQETMLCSCRNRVSDKVRCASTTTRFQCLHVPRLAKRSVDEVARARECGLCVWRRRLEPVFLAEKCWAVGPRVQPQKPKS